MDRSEDSELEIAAREFFGFGDRPDTIHLVLPGFPNQRRPTLRASNYPPYQHALTPDDVLSAMTIHSLLAANYGPNKIHLHYHDEQPVAGYANRVLIGGPPTNSYVSAALDGLGLTFTSNDHERAIVGGRREYRVELDSRRNVVTDYCLLARIQRKPTGNVIVVAGLRAYGQIASSLFLADVNFYRGQDLQLITNFDTFQILIRADVRGSVVSKWELVDFHPSVTDVFVSYNREDREQAEQFATRLQKKGLRISMDTQLRPGQNWVRQLDDHIRSSKAVAVLLGRHGFGPTQMLEYEAALAESTRRSTLKLFAVLLPSWKKGKGASHLPPFLHAKQHFDASGPIGPLVESLRTFNPPVDQKTRRSRARPT